jgi:hypothetical protein
MIEKVTPIGLLQQPMPGLQQHVGIEFKAGIGASHLGSMGVLLEPGSGLLIMVDGAGNLAVTKVAGDDGQPVRLFEFGLAVTVRENVATIEAHQRV